MLKINSEINISEHFEDPRLLGEKIVFETIEKNFKEPWSVFYSVEWFGYQSLGKDGFFRDGEIDFLFTHPKYGIFVCEVKGGIEISVDEGKWYSLSKSNKKNPIKDPFKQAKTSKHQIVEKLFTDTGVKLKKIHHFVIFPEVNEVVGFLPFHIEDSILITANKLSSLEGTLINLSSTTGIIDNDRNDMNIRAIDWLKSKVGTNLKIQLKLRDQLNQIDQKIIELSEEQASIFDLLSYQKEVHILGVAGSGKTILATNKAMELASQKKRTLLLCFNSILGVEFSKFSKNIINLDALNYHRLIYNYCRENRMLGKTIEENEAFFFKNILEDKIDKYDAIIIDEVQDFSDDQLSIIRMMCKDDGFFATFGDINQNIIFNRDDFKSARPYTLTRNYRNTKPIFDLLLKHVPSETIISHMNVHGPEVRLKRKYAFNDANSLKRSIKSEIIDLVKDKIEPKDIVVLTFMSKEQSKLNDMTIDGFNLTLFEDEREDNSIRVDSIRRFKGMDSKVVILTEMDDAISRQDDDRWHRTCYVAYSRARSLLIIIPPSNIESSIL